MAFIVMMTARPDKDGLTVYDVEPKDGMSGQDLVQEIRHAGLGEAWFAAASFRGSDRAQMRCTEETRKKVEKLPSVSRVHRANIAVRV